VVSVETFKIQCPPVRGMIVPVGNKCAFSPSVKLRFWPLRSPPEDYGAEFLETGLYDEETIPEDLLDSLYGELEGITFSWDYMSATDFNNGLSNWLPYPGVTGPVLEITDASGIDLIMDRYYRVRYTGYEACRGEVPQRADTQLELRVEVENEEGAELQFDRIEDTALQLRSDQNSNGGQWNYVGTISAAAGETMSVTFGGNDHDVEEEGGLPRLFADAVRFVKVKHGSYELPGSQQVVTIVDNPDADELPVQNTDQIGGTTRAGAPPGTGAGVQALWTAIVSPGQYGKSALYYNGGFATVPEEAQFRW